MPTYQYQQGDRPLDGYTIQYALGRGGFGEVYFAISDAGREVALKVIQNYEEIELRGIRHCMNLKSPHLVTIFDVRFADNNTPWVIMEYVSGPSLREIIDESPEGLGTQRTAFLFQELAKGISYLHDAGVVHRDLKPHNVFFEDGTVKIGDYSLSKSITTSHRSGHTTTVGSVHYMAPEISMGRYDKSVDIYALGVILYEMLRGVPPYVGESMGEVLMKHLKGSPDVSGIAEPFASTISRAMRSEPAERFQTAQAMAESLFAERDLTEQLHSFNPMTLSMVGERERQLKDNRKVRESSPMAETFTTPAMLRDTTPDANASLEETSEPVGLLQQFALWYTPSEITDRNPDRLHVVVRLLVAIFAGAMLFGLHAAFSNVISDYKGEEVVFHLTLFLSVALVVCLGMVGLTNLKLGSWPWCGIEAPARFDHSFSQRVLFGLATRAFIVASAYAVLVYTKSNVPDIDARNILGVGGGLIASLMVLDWRCFMAPHRHHRIMIRPTLMVGMIAVLVASDIVADQEHFEFLVATLAISLAVALQLVAPLRRARLRAFNCNTVEPEETGLEPLSLKHENETQEIVG
jgi:serine/threonine protein kinase